VKISFSAAFLGVKVCHYLTISLEQPFCGEESFNPHGASGMDPACADADLSSQTKPVAIGKPRADVVEDAGTVHLGQELLGRCV